MRWLVLMLWALPAAAAEYTYVPAASFGRRACGAVSPNWRETDFDDRAWADLPPIESGIPLGTASREAPRLAPLGSPTPDAGAGCASSVYARWRFDAGSELARLAALTLRLRYEHGFVAYLNGVEIARRRVDANATFDTLATETHGPEWDRLSLPLKPGQLRASGNLLAVEVHPRTRGRSPQLDVELSASDGPRIVRGPYLQRLSEKEVTVIYDTDLPTPGQVTWGPVGEPSLVAATPLQTHHALRLHPLLPGTVYQYRVNDSGDVQFHTPPSVGRPLRFVVYGDVRSGHDVHAQLARSIVDEDPDLALVTGDLVDRGSDEGDWEKFFEVAAQLVRRVAIFPAPGNHEYARLGRGLGNFLQLFRSPLREGEDETAYYSFDAAGVHFVALDSNQYGSPRQLAWLDKDLGDAEKHGARASFAFAHEGAWSTGLHGDNATCIKDYVPVLERHKVAMFFYGHDHHYERGRVGKLDYVVTGGGGAELRPPRCIPGKKCPPRVLEYLNDHNYVSVEVLPSLFRVCPKHPDGTPIFPCTSLPLRR